MGKVKCICGRRVLEFVNLTQDDFPNGWEQPCCKDEVPLAAFEDKPKPLIEQWLDVSGLRDRSRNGVWMPAWRCHSHYSMWLKSRGLDEQIPTTTKFGRDLKKYCSSKRKNQGRFYLLEKAIV